MKNKNYTDTEIRTKVRIVLTGGGTAGHVIPHVSLMPLMKKYNWDIHYIGSSGIEKKIISDEDHSIPYYEISTGKLRRYFSWENFKDLFKVIWGVFQSLFFLRRIRPQVIFSKGGYVSVPVCVGAWLLRIPVVTHESDVTPGLANRIITMFARKVFYSFPETRKYLEKYSKDIVLMGIPIRDQLSNGNRDRLISNIGFQKEGRPTILIIGGSLGSKRINLLVRQNLDDLLKTFQVIHITGQGNIDRNIQHQYYFQTEFVSKGLEDYLDSADLVVSRSGANTIFELLYLDKSMLLIPLKKGSRGDQIINAEIFRKHGWADVLDELTCTSEEFVRSITTRIQSKIEKKYQSMSFDFPKKEVYLKEISLVLK